MVIALRTADEFSVATPADWRTGDDVIVPTAGSCTDNNVGVCDFRSDTLGRNYKNKMLDAILGK